MASSRRMERKKEPSAMKHVPWWSMAENHSPDPSLFARRGGPEAVEIAWGWHQASPGTSRLVVVASGLKSAKLWAIPKTCN